MATIATTKIIFLFLPEGAQDALAGVAFQFGFNRRTLFCGVIGDSDLLGDGSGILLPQSPQNFLLSGFSAPQFGHLEAIPMT
jgi:hypothetical protein